MEWINPYIPAAFIVAGMVATFKLQFQALYYLLAVIFCVQTLDQFIFVNLFFAGQILFSRLYSAAGSNR